MQHHVQTGGFKPQAYALLLHICKFFQPVHCLRQTLKAEIYHFTATQAVFHDQIQHIHRICQPVDGSLHLRQRVLLTPVTSRGFTAKLQPPIFHELRDLLSAARQLRMIAQLSFTGQIDITAQVQQQPAGQVLTKIITGDIRQLMRFVKDHYVHLR